MTEEKMAEIWRICSIDERHTSFPYVTPPYLLIRLYTLYIIYVFDDLYIIYVFDG